MGNETVAIAKTANKATASGESSYGKNSNPPQQRENLTLLIDAECFCGTKVKSDWITAENLSYAVGGLLF